MYNDDDDDDVKVENIAHNIRYSTYKYVVTKV